MKKLIFATGNKDKVKEAKDILGIPLEIAQIELEEVQSMDIEYVVRKKAEEAFSKLKKPLIVDDVGFKIEAWNGFPGPFVKFLFASLGRQKVLDLLKDEKNRNVLVQGSIAYHDGKTIHTFVGEIKGQISTEERGTDGWGFDFIVIPEGEDKTLAELGFKEKNKLSHRHAGLTKLKEFLDLKNRK